MVLDWSIDMVVVSWSIVCYHHSNTLQLCALACHSCVTSH